MDPNKLDSYLPGRASAPACFGCLTAGTILVLGFGAALSGAFSAKGIGFWLAQLPNVAAIMLFLILVTGGGVYAYSIFRNMRGRMLHSCLVTAKCFMHTTQSRERAVNSTFWGIVTFLLLWSTWPSNIQYIWGILALVSLGSLDWFMKAFHPPLILVLTSSTIDNFMLLARVRQHFMVRTVALLEPQACDAATLTAHVQRDNFRTDQTIEWQDVVRMFGHVVVVIVMDVRKSTPAIQEEIASIVENSFIDKALLLVDPAQGCPEWIPRNAEGEVSLGWNITTEAALLRDISARMQGVMGMA